jgi:hypothetical protein
MDRRRFLAASAAAPLALAAPVAAGASDARTLRIAFPSPEAGFDPAQVQDQYSNQIILHIFGAPLRYDCMARPARRVPNTTVLGDEQAAFLPQLIAHRIQLDLSQPWVRGFRRPLFTTRRWTCLDIDPAMRRG